MRGDCWANPYGDVHILNTKDYEIVVSKWNRTRLWYFRIVNKENEHVFFNRAGLETLEEAKLLSVEKLQQVVRGVITAI
jgi:hypothetical protein